MFTFTFKATTIARATPTAKQAFRFSVGRFASTLRITNHELDHGVIAQVAFDRPEAKNAVSRDLLNQFSEYISKLATNHDSVANVRALILSSTNDKVFCAGADLKERKTFTPNDTAMFLQQFNQSLTMMEQLAIPTISSIQGLALGGGLEIALSTDFRVLSSTAQVGLPETRLAIIPGAGGTHRLPKLVGYSRALDLILTGRRVPASEALQLGLANRVADAESTSDATALEFAKQICDGGPLAITAAKAAVRAATEDAQKLEYAKVVNSKDKFEALDAFANKRKPMFKGE